MTPRQELPDWLRAQPFTAFDHSVKRGRMAGVDVVRVFHGVCAVSGGPADWRDVDGGEGLRRRCRALLRVAPPGTFLGSITAARLWELPLPPGYRDDETIHTVIWYPGRAPRRPGVRGRQIDDWEAGRVEEPTGLPTIYLPTLFCHLGQVLAVPDLVAVGDALIRQPVYRTPDQRPPVPISVLRDRVERYHRGGKRTAAQALELVRPGAESRPETLTRLLLADAGLPEPELNVELRDPDGRFVGRVDMLYRRFRVGVEYDGDQHRTDRDQYDRDMGRLDDLAAIGYRVVRINARMLFRTPGETVARVRHALIAAGWQPT